MTRRIVLHIGSPKCGSTFLQQVLLNNRAALAAAGVVYPHAGSGHPGNAATLDLWTRQDFETAFRSDPETGGRLVHTVILSHEDLFAQPRRGESLQALAEATGVQVQVVAFLRPFSEFIFGDYSQFMKQYFERFLAARLPYEGRGFEQFTVDRANRLAPLSYFRKWQLRFPDVPLMLRPHNAIRAAIEPFIAGAVLDWNVPRNMTNPSLRMTDCDALAAMIRDPAISAETVRSAFHAAFHKVSEPDPGRTAERMAWIEAIFSQQNAELLEEFGFDNRLATGSPDPL